jgi:hypothetical protein
VAWRSRPATAQAPRVCSIPTLNRKIAAAAATDRASAHGSTLERTGASNDKPKLWTGMVARNSVWIANQIARLRMTPTTAKGSQAYAEEADESISASGL